jgi:hypothetical protein
MAISKITVGVTTAGQAASSINQTIDLTEQNALSLSDVSQSLQTLTNTVSSQGLSIGELETEVNTLSQNLSTLSGTVGNHTLSISGLSNELDTQSQTISALQSDVSAKLDSNAPVLADIGTWNAEIVSQTEAEQGTSTTERKWTAQRVAQAIAALAPSGGDNPISFDIAAFENLIAGEFVHVFDDAGVAKVRKATADTSRYRAHGFVLSAANVGEMIKVYFIGVNNAVSDASPGSVFLSTTAGSATAVPPSGAGQMVQNIGVAVSATAIAFVPQEPIGLA